MGHNKLHAMESLPGMYKKYYQLSRSLARIERERVLPELPYEIAIKLINEIKKSIEDTAEEIEKAIQKIDVA